MLPLLYLHGLSSGDFREALPALLGPQAAGLAPSTITRLTKTWTAEYEAFRRRELANRDYVYLWADGIHFTIRLEDERLCALVLIGVRPDGTRVCCSLGIAFGAERCGDAVGQRGQHEAATVYAGIVATAWSEVEADIRHGNAPRCGAGRAPLLATIDLDACPW